MESKKISDYTEAEFFSLISELFNRDFSSEEERDAVVYAIVNAAEHPDGTDIIFYPKEDEEDSPEGVLKRIKEWRATKSLPDFKAG
ncbi:bacteriocin immunity protein [Pseudomonas aeruginosa]|uniref:Bacteriocin immunity protein n=1 Tax=Pseudomonas aeruginosa TaxID=287 RepID=A0A6A9K4M2_PSEAI|nr:bacteriocin immunity protein [Pseudomonas aeruginosa]MUI60477.1 bacteriocin immunity protein [Pseudomonas aeruginosa]